MSLCRVDCSPFGKRCTIPKRTCSSGEEGGVRILSPQAGSCRPQPAELRSPGAERPPPPSTRTAGPVPRELELPAPFPAGCGCAAGGDGARPWATRGLGPAGAGLAAGPAFTRWEAGPVRPPAAACQRHETCLISGNLSFWPAAVVEKMIFLL